jgi:hypothetical protein
MLPELLATLAVATPSVACAEHIEGGAETAAERRRAVSQSVVRDGVIFWGLRNAARETFDRRQDSWKAAISVPYGVPLLLQVAMPDRSWLELTYDRENREGAPKLRFVPCAPDTPRFSDGGVVGNETAWAGGFNVKREGLRDTAPPPSGRGAVAQGACGLRRALLVDDGRDQLGHAGGGRYSVRRSRPRPAPRGRGCPIPPSPRARSGSCGRAP